jgi:predicted Fe-Mo cluster-binding NifX family protein
MKIAFVTDDGKTISQHFGRATHYLVITVENGDIVNREMREKAGHAKFHSEGHEHKSSDQPHGFGTDADHKHGLMADTITDCEAVLCRGMGRGAYESMQSYNIRPVVTDFENIDSAVKAYISGQIVDHIEKLH